jgi:MFS family permease
MTDSISAEGGRSERLPFRKRLPDFSVLKDRRVVSLIVAKNFSKLGIATISYGAMVYLADSGASQIQVSIVGAMGYLAALLFGTQGGAVVDSTTKRNAMIAGYCAQAVLCFVFPTFFGTSVLDLTALAFLVAAMATITSPAIKATVAVIATPVAMAMVAAMLSLFGSLGTAVGQAFVAPVLIKVSGIELVMYVSGLILGAGAIWVYMSPSDEKSTGKSFRQVVTSIDWKPNVFDFRGILDWIASNRVVATIVLVAAIVFALSESLGTLIPVYMRDVLDADPALSIYIFAPAGIGYLIGALVSPGLIGKYGERRMGTIALLICSGGIMLFGMIDLVAPFLAPFSPTRLFEVFFDVDLSEQMLAAGFISIPANFGSTAAGSSVQNFINRHLPVTSQGGVFGMQKVIENILALTTVIGLGAIATLIGSQAVFLIAPAVVVAMVVWLLRYARRQTGTSESRREALGELWNNAEDEAVALGAPAASLP